MNENYHIDHDLLVKYLLGESSREEALEIAKWISTDKRHQKYYDDFKIIWEESKRFAVTSNVDEASSWERLRNRIHDTAKKPVPVKLLTAYYWLRIAAVFIIIASAAAVLIYSISGNRQVQVLAVRSQGKVIKDTLPDGSIITLNKNSIVSYPRGFKTGSRAISLEGEAFFSITPDKSRPFIIHVNDVTVRVTGTSFNIKNIHGNTEVIVETGVVQVIKKNRMVELRPAEKILVKKEDSTLVKENEAGNLYNYYRTKEFECDNTPLWRLVEVLNEAYDVNIVIGRNELRNLPLTTTFNNESLDNILGVIRQTFTISVTKTAGQIILR
ncbi:MAG: FecR domain-containing protein [Ginsengibacter sp.]